MLPEKLRRPAPGQLRRLPIMHRQALLVAKTVLGVVAENLERLAGGLHALLEAVDQLRGAPVVPGGEVRLKWDPDVRGLGRLLRWDTVEHHARGELGDFGGADDRHRAAEAKPGQADLGAVPGE